MDPKGIYVVASAKKLVRTRKFAILYQNNELVQNIRTR